MKLIILICTSAVFGLMSCDNHSQQKTVKTKNSTVDTIPSAIKNLTVTDKSSLTINFTNFPIDSLFTSKVLTTGSFHSDEVWDNADKLKWFGLFKSKTGFYISETKLITKKVYDPIEDENENDKSGWEVQTINKDTSIILLESSKFLKPCKVQQAILAKDEILPGENLRFKYLGVDYKLYATGVKKKDQYNPEWFDVWDYKLYLSATIKGKQITSLLVAEPNFNDQMTKLIFTGDIDEDGILDLIIDTSNHYNSTSPTIYLSRPANNEELVKPIGEHTSVGC